MTLRGQDAGNLRQRVLSAIVLAVVVLALTWAGGVWYRLLAAVIGAAVFYEWITMAGARDRPVLGLVAAVPLLALVWGLPALVLLGLLLLALAVAGIHARWMGAGPWPVAGLAYAGLTAIALAGLRGADAAGLAATLFLFAVVWATDILAYFTGRALGGPKLAPSISPGKTWSGAVGGAVAAVLAGLAVAASFGALPGWAALFALALVLSVVSQAGDLFESALKRRFGVKDSSQLIPGHGGVMDRVDGLAAAALALFVIGALAAAPDTPAHALFTP